MRGAAAHAAGINETVHAASVNPRMRAVESGGSSEVGATCLVRLRTEVHVVFEARAQLLALLLLGVLRARDDAHVLRAI